MAEFLGYEDAMLFNSGFGGALGTISGLLRKSDVAVMDNRSHLSFAMVRCSRGRVPSVLSTTIRNRSTPR